MAAGWSHGNALLNETKVKEIKLLLLNGEHYKDIAKKFKVKPATIMSIKHGRSWARVKV